MVRYHLSPSFHLRWIQAILTSGDHLLHLVSDLTELDGFETGRIRLKPTVKSLRHTFFEALQVLEPLFGSKSPEPPRGIVLHYDPSFATPIFVCIALGSYVLNLPQVNPDLQLRVVCHPSVPDLVRADHTRIRQILINLLHNSSVWRLPRSDKVES